MRVPPFPSLTSSSQRSDHDLANFLGTLAELNVVFHSSIASGQLASGSCLPTRKLSLINGKDIVSFFRF